MAKDKRQPSFEDGFVATAEPPPVPPPPVPAPATPRPRVACVGLPVQYHTLNGEAVAALLTREALTEPGAWDLIVFLPGALTTSSRAAVRPSDEPRAGHWTFLPD